jgi:hypothetical protein
VDVHIGESLASSLTDRSQHAHLILDLGHLRLQTLPGSRLPDEAARRVTHPE